MWLPSVADGAGADDEGIFILPDLLALEAYASLLCGHGCFQSDLSPGVRPPQRMILHESAENKLILSP